MKTVTMILLPTVVVGGILAIKPPAVSNEAPTPKVESTASTIQSNDVSETQINQVEATPSNPSSTAQIAPPVISRGDDEDGEHEGKRRGDHHEGEDDEDDELDEDSDD